MSAAIELRGIRKSYGAVAANRDVDLTVARGAIHAIVGENGAGKSTLLRIAYGDVRADAGRISLEGEDVPRARHSPAESIRRGVGMVHQHFMLVGPMTVAENVALGREPTRDGRLDLERVAGELKALAVRFGFAIDPHARIDELSVGEQQRVEILKMLYRGVEVLIMDEPTAVLAPQEIGELFRTLRAMVKEGKSIVFISHKLNEVMEVCDRVTVLRQGRVTAAGLRSAETSIPELARLMVGRAVLFDLDKKPQTPGEVVLQLEGVCAANDKGLQALKNVSLTVRAGEIVGVAGVAGNGQTELAEVITGLRRCTAGQILVTGEDVANRSANVTIHKGVAHVPEDRTHVGSAPTLSITDNVIMKSYWQPPVAHGWSLDGAAARKKAQTLKEEYAILAPTIDTPARMLSGGNLQRMILARELSAKPKLLIAVQPTRGLDVGAIESVQRLLLAQREQGAGILLISEELEEIFSLSDRLLVMYGGEIAGEVREHDAETVGLMMTGAKRQPVEG